VSGQRKPWHSGDFNRVSRTMRAQANADPTTTCWRDGRTLAEHGPNATWNCGHIKPHEMHLYQQHPSPYATWSTGSDRQRRLCAPEVAGCNTSQGATDGNRTREPHTPW
jgi:hypothetical protein